MEYKMRDRPHGVIKPRLDLQKKAGRPLKALDPKEINSIETEINGLINNASEWITEELGRLLSARNAFQQNIHSEETASELYRAAHDLRGLGLPLGFPIVSTIAGSLCKILKSKEIIESVLDELVNAHVDAIRLVVKHQIRDAESGPGFDLVNELSRLNAKLTTPAP